MLNSQRFKSLEKSSICFFCQLTELNWSTRCELLKSKCLGWWHQLSIFLRLWKLKLGRSWIDWITLVLQKMGCIYCPPKVIPAPGTTPLIKVRLLRLKIQLDRVCSPFVFLLDNLKTSTRKFEPETFFVPELFANCLGNFSQVVDEMSLLESPFGYTNYPFVFARLSGWIHIQSDPSGNGAALDPESTDFGGIPHKSTFPRIFTFFFQYQYFEFGCATVWPVWSQNVANSNPDHRSFNSAPRCCNRLH